jgi:hypothetical protein
MKLRQTTTMTEYTTQFESLSNHLCGISDKNHLSCFLSGLKDEIRLPLWMLNPVTLAAAFDLAKLQEEYILNTHHSLRSPSPSYSYSKQLPLPLQRSPPAVPIQKLSLA